MTFEINVRIMQKFKLHPGLRTSVHLSCNTAHRLTMHYRSNIDYSIPFLFCLMMMYIGLVLRLLKIHVFNFIRTLFGPVGNIS